MKRIGLRGIPGVFGAWDVQVNDNGFLAASYDHCFHWLIPPGVELLVGNKRRDINEIARAGYLRVLAAVE